MTTHVSSVNSQHRGRVIVGTAVESFDLDLPQGSRHLALVFEPMRDPFWLFVRRIAGEDRVNGRVLPLIKAHLKILLEGLDFLHSECHVIHTGALPLLQLPYRFTGSWADLFPLRPETR